MPIRHSLRVIPVIALAALAGCAMQPKPDRLDAMVTTSQLDARLSSLEDALVQNCRSQNDQLQSHETHLGTLGNELGAEMRDVGKTLSGLRADIEQLGGEPDRATNDCPANQDSLLENKEVLGRNEWVGFPTIGTYLKARIDSGANTGSLSATDITEFEREGEDWVRFKLALNDETTAVDSVRGKWVEAEVTRRVRIIQASGQESRPVVSLLMQLGPIKQNVDFTLNDRTHLSHPVLLGRRFMMDIALIDVSKTYLHERPEYPGGEPAAQAAADEAKDLVDDDEEDENEDDEDE